MKLIISIQQSVIKSGYYGRFQIMTILPVSAKRKHFVMKEPATGFLIETNSGVGLNKQTQNISGATGFVCNLLLSSNSYYNLLTYARLKLAVENLYSRINPPPKHSLSILLSK
jgi:hypothetical protein